MSIQWMMNEEDYKDKRSKKILVKITLELPVEVPDDGDYDEFFDIEENHCPGTGFVWLALSEHINKCNAMNVCWACSLKGTNQVINQNDK